MSGPYPDNNPKTAIGAMKVPLHLVPPVASHYMALAFRDGAGKYGPYNWREHKVSASVYLGAARRHLDAWWDGEDISHDAQVHHLGHVMACCAILLDSMSVDKLNDDRPPSGATGALQRLYAPEPGVVPVSRSMEDLQ
ncbi:dATP/dGTP diphosphohydrolase domain-containing protein [Luteimonas sp. RIT-PG2_3]